jgi:hypothetical protein
MVNLISESMDEMEIALATLRNYAEESNYKSYEKDYGCGQIVERSPWITRDKGDNARRALQLIEKKRKAKNEKS